MNFLKYLLVTLLLAITNYDSCEATVLPANKTKTFLSNLPMKSTVPFVGRGNELNLIHWLNSQHKHIVVTGPKGVGKTELVRKYASDIFKSENGNVFWINGASFSSMVNRLAKIANLFGRFDGNKNLEGVFKELFYHFKSTPTLLIFDNAFSDNCLINKIVNFMDGKPNNITIIITSVINDWPESIYTTIELAPFTTMESLKFMKLALQEHYNPLYKNKYTVLANRLDNTPYNLLNAADYIVKFNTNLNNHSLEEFMVMLKRHNALEMLDYYLKDGSNVNFKSYKPKNVKPKEEKPKANKPKKSGKASWKDFTGI